MPLWHYAGAKNMRLAFARCLKHGRRHERDRHACMA
jgi:hypothetical protein